LPAGPNSLRVAGDSATKAQNGATEPVVVDQSTPRQLVYVADARSVIHDGDRVEVIGERRTRQWFGFLTVAWTASKMHGIDHETRRYQPYMPGG